MPEATTDVDCPCCDLVVPADRAADIQTPYGPVSVCLGCHPTRWR